jgi:hypothetical protein
MAREENQLRLREPEAEADGTRQTADGRRQTADGRRQTRAVREERRGRLGRGRLHSISRGSKRETSQNRERAERAAAA